MDKKPHGRTLVFTKEMLETVEELAAQGMDQQDIAQCIGLHASTLSEKKNVVPELGEALKKGKARGLERVTKALLNNIDLGNVTAQIFYLKCKGQWKETNVTEHHVTTHDDAIKELE